MSPILRLIIEFKAQIKFRFQVRPLGFISVIATTVGLLDIAVPIMHFAAYVGNRWINCTVSAKIFIVCEPIVFVVYLTI
jgi:hypothetical protein